MFKNYDLYCNLLQLAGNQGKNNNNVKLILIPYQSTLKFICSYQLALSFQNSRANLVASRKQQMMLCSWSKVPSPALSIQLPLHKIEVL